MAWRFMTWEEEHTWVFFFFFPPFSSCPLPFWITVVGLRTLSSFSWTLDRYLCELRVAYIVRAPGLPSLSSLVDSRGGGLVWLGLAWLCSMQVMNEAEQGRALWDEMEIGNWEPRR